MSGKLNLGRSDLMAVAAFRYCLGRQTYIVSDCAEWLKEIWDALSNNAKIVIKRDLLIAIKDDDEARKRGDSYYPLGHDMDRNTWLDVRDFIDKQSENEA